MDAHLDFLLRWDELLRQGITAVHHPILDWLFWGLTSLAARGWGWVALGVVLVWRQPARAPGFWRMLLALWLASLVTNQILKPVVGRPRPSVTQSEVRVVGRQPGSYAFPSGHAAEAFASALALSQLWPRGRRGLFALASLVALSRVYLGVHYPLDVVAGAAVGLGCGVLATGVSIPTGHKLVSQSKTTV